LTYAQKQFYSIFYSYTGRSDVIVANPLQTVRHQCRNIRSPDTSAPVPKGHFSTGTEVSWGRSVPGCQSVCKACLAPHVMFIVNFSLTKMCS